MKMNVGYYVLFCVINNVYHYASSALNLFCIRTYSATAKSPIVFIIRLVGIIWKIKDTLEWLFIKTRFN